MKLEETEVWLREIIVQSVSQCLNTHCVWTRGIPLELQLATAI